MDAHLEGGRRPCRRRRPADDRRHQRDAVPRGRGTGVHVAPRGRGADRVSVRTGAVHASFRSLARARRARRSLGVHGLEELLQPAGVCDLARERHGVAAGLGGAVVSHADTQRALPRVPGWQHRHQREPAARARAADERRRRRARRPRPRVGSRHGVPQRPRRGDLEYHAHDHAGAHHARAAECRPARIVRRRESKATCGRTRA